MKMKKMKMKAGRTTFSVGRYIVEVMGGNRAGKATKAKTRCRMGTHLA